MRASYGASVFINCPFDDEYRGMLFAAVFAILDCGYQPRCAQEADDGGEVRIDKIRKIIEACKFGIHDISRIEVGENGLPRFNMPFELGIFLGARYYGKDQQKQKQTLILDRDRHRYQAFLSDIAGQDIRAHNGSARELIGHVRNWLANSTQRITIPGARTIQARFNEFQGNLPQLCEALGLEPEELQFNEYTWLAAQWLQKRGKQTR